MATKHPRLCVVLDEEVFQRIRVLSKIKNVSMSSLVCDLVRVALDLEEDLLFAKFLEEREKDLQKEARSSDAYQDVSKE